MNSSALSSASPATSPSSTGRFDHLDATRAFALILGVVFHSALSFMPTFMGWAVQDVSTGAIVSTFAHVSHSFRMELFFLLAGFLTCGALQRQGTSHFVRGRLVRLGLPFLCGWFLLRPLLVSGWLMGSASLRGDYQFWPSILDGIRNMDTLPEGLLVGSHLWFLYYLIIVTTAVLVARAVLRPLLARASRPLARIDQAFNRLCRSAWMLPSLVTLTGAPLWFMRNWGVDTPDQSLAIHWPAFSLYGGFFGFGWLLGRQPELLRQAFPLSPARALAAISAAWLSLRLSPYQLDSGHPQHALLHALFVLSYAAMMWGLVVTVIAFFQRFAHQPHAVTRFVADGAYWLYLVHLPIAIWLQVAIAEVPWHWSFKLACVSGLTVAAGLLTYDLFVRSTWLGAVLNGRRRERFIGSFFLTRKSHEIAKATGQ